MRTVNSKLQGVDLLFSIICDCGQQVAVAELGTSALAALNQRMRAYTAASAATASSSATENGGLTPTSAWTWSSLASRAAVEANSQEQDPLPAGVPHIGLSGV